MKNKSSPQYYFDENEPDKILTLQNLKSQHQKLLDLIPSDGRSFEEFLFDANYRNGGTIREYNGK